jgi:hypothetical protein
MLAPPVGSQASFEVGPGATVSTLQTGYLAYKLQVMTRGRRVSTRCHASHSSAPRLFAQEGSSTATRPTALNLTSLLGRALVLSRVPWLWAPPPGLG